jgi:hypothetical protein
MPVSYQMEIVVHRYRQSEILQDLSLYKWGDSAYWFQTRFRQWDLRTTRITPVWTGRTMLEDNRV